MPVSNFILVSRREVKPELVAALAMHQDPESLIICNGYKDAAFIRIALLGCKLSKKVVIVAEKLEELEQTIRAAKEVGVEPHIGIRVRLYSKGAGKWAPSGGENAKFGLDTTSLVAASEMLKAAGLAHCLKLIHFHVGSQVPDISTIKRAVREGARYYAKIAKLGHELGYLDVGGGLGVDYDGSRSDFDSSANYSLQEYVNDVVWNIMDVCDSEGVPHPAIVSEGGRAIVAHHSVLVMEAFSSIEKTAPKLRVNASEKDHKLVGDILDVKQRLKRGNRLESLHDIQQIKEEAQQNFEFGLLDLESKGKDRHNLLAARAADREYASRLALYSRGSQAARNHVGRSVHLQFLGFPIAARHLGAWSIVSDHADSSA
jgi:arginine decarboxylase